MYNVRSMQIVILKDVNHPVFNLFAWKKWTVRFKYLKLQLYPSILNYQKTLNFTFGYIQSKLR